jgi:hypothetical protein
MPGYMLAWAARWGVGDSSGATIKLLQIEVGRIPFNKGDQLAFGRLLHAGLCFQSVRRALWSSCACCMSGLRGLQARARQSTCSCTQGSTAPPGLTASSAPNHLTRAGVFWQQRGHERQPAASSVAVSARGDVTYAPPPMLASHTSLGRTWPGTIDITTHILSAWRHALAGTQANAGCWRSPHKHIQLSWHPRIAS